MSDTPTHTPGVGINRHESPVDLLRDLIRFDTTNPPGNERGCIEWIMDLLAAYGVDYETYAANPSRPSLVARIPGGDAPPLMLYGHVDVVPADGDWEHPPFEGVLEDGYVWGRGALDMKAGVAMFLAAFLRVADDPDPPGDLLLCIVPDEEGGGDEGMGYLVEEHPAVFADVEFALGEFGAFSLDTGGHRFYPIQVNEKQVCWLEATFRGEGGHGSLPSSDDATARMARFVSALDGRRLPVHVDPVTDEMVTIMGEALSAPRSLLLRTLLMPRLTDRTLDIMGEDGLLFDALLHNVVNETIVRGGSKENVVPEETTLTLDCRLLPGQTPEDVIDEIESLVGTPANHAEFDIIRFDEGPNEADMKLFDTLGAVLEDADRGATAIPLLLPGTSDARHLSRLGIQSYGFTPMNLPSDFPFMEFIHAPDERVPADCVEWGTERVSDVIQRMAA